MPNPPFHLPHFLPYLLNQAAEAASQDFQAYYKGRYGMLRTEWRVLFHLGCHGEISAKEICEMASIHKTKVSRAVGALEAKRYLSRKASDADRRIERLTLTRQGRAVFDDLSAAAERFERTLVDGVAPQDLDALRRVLIALSDLQDPSER
jgi:DNA-binding MarR family transcriptional regulator